MDTVSEDTQIPQLPNNIDFATEVKSDRLDLLSRITLFFSLVMLLAMVGLNSVESVRTSILVPVMLVLLSFSMLTRWALRRQYFETAALIFTLGGVMAVSTALLDTQPLTLQVAPFGFVVVIFIGGLMIRPTLNLLVTLLAVLLTLLVPFLQTGGMAYFSGHQLVAILLMFVGAGLTAQVTGELYAVAEWALMNYQRERRTNFDLFESRNELRKSLLRSEALSERLKEINTQLEEARMAAEEAKKFRGQFLANMSHELRTPLNAIIGFSETMLKFPVMYDDTPMPEIYKSDLNQIYNSGQQLLHLINDILDLARVDAGKLELHREAVNPAGVIQAVMTTAKGLASNKPIEMKSSIPDQLPVVWADEIRFRQVLLNVYSNAIKFTDEGCISLMVKETDDRHLQFSVQDTGAGIEADKLQLIFEEFKQAQTAGRDPRSGSGLGLTISRQLLDMMDGRIWAESTVGEGSTFHFTLPLYHHQKDDTAESNAVPQDDDSTAQEAIVDAQTVVEAPVIQEDKA